MKFEFRYESLKNKFSLILFVNKLMMGFFFHNNRENYLRKFFWTKEKETQVKLNPGLSANRPLNNWAQCYIHYNYDFTWMLADDKIMTGFIQKIETIFTGFSRTTYQECNVTHCTKMHIPSPFWQDFEPWTLCSKKLLYIFGLLVLNW